MALKQGHYDILLAQMLRSPLIADSAIENLEGAFLSRSDVGGTDSQAILFNIIKNYYQEYKEAPDDAVILAEAQHYSDSFNGSAVGLMPYVQHFIQFKDNVDGRSEALSRKVISVVADQCVFQPQATELLEDALSGGGLEGLGERLTQLEEAKSATLGGSSVRGIFDDADLSNLGTRVPTYIPWLDARFGKGAGPVNGSVIGIIAPQGTGKTTLGIQLAVSQALNGKHVLLVLAEEPFNLSLRAKVASCVIGVSYEEILQDDGVSFDARLKNVIKAHSDKIDKHLVTKKLSMLHDHLHVLDIVDDPSQLQKIAAEHHFLTTQGMKPAYTYVDWAGIIADALTNVSGNSKEQELKTISYAMNRLAQTTNSLVCISQQMAGKYVQKGPFFNNNEYCAADCRGFTEPMKYVLVVNPQELQYRYSILTFAKVRDEECGGERALVHLRGDISTFYDVTDRYEIRMGRIVSKRSAKRGRTVPKE